MLLLEPSAENPLNMDAYSYYISQSDTFEQLAQKSILGGCNISGVKFQSVCIREPIQGLPWQQQASNSQQLPNRATDGRSDDGVFNPARMSPISSHLYLQRSNNTSTTSMSMNGNDTASSEGQEGQEGQEGGCSSSNSCSVMDSYSPMSASSGSARAISRSNDSMGSLQGNGSSGCNINIGLDFSAPHFSPAALATGTVASGGRAKKRSYDETENLPMQMEQYRLACNPSMPRYCCRT